MSIPPADADERASGLERLVFFSDAVLAIVITLLVLPLAAEVDLPEAGGGLAHQVWALWPKMLSFVISFLVIGQYWISHHRLFVLVRRYDQRLLWLNLVFLLTVTFMPFPTALVGAQSRPQDHFAAVFYAASVTLAGLTLTGIALYARRAGLLDLSVDGETAAYLLTRSVVTTVLFLVSVGAAYLGGLRAGLLFWVLLIPLTRLLLARRHDTLERARQSRATRSR
jgi:uncharacterized membrane protein